MNEWIDVNFAVPPDRRKVLTLEITRYGEKLEKVIYIYKLYRRIVFKNGKIKWENAEGTGYMGHVNYWMPLPESPE